VKLVVLSFLSTASKCEALHHQELDLYKYQLIPDLLYPLDTEK